MEVIDRIGPGPVALDTAAFIYFIEQHPRYFPLLKPLFEVIDRGGLMAVTSAITLLETLVVPYRNGALDVVLFYETFLRQGRGLVMLPIDVPVLKLAAEIRAMTSARALDSLQLAAASVTRCTAIVTNDHRMPELPGLTVLQLDDFTSA